MRTLILTLTVMLFAAPAWATVDITVEWTSATEVAIGYDSDEVELVRAFALDVTAADGNIVGIAGYALGDDNNGYGIFPGSFADAGVQVDAGTGEVVDWGIAGYTPVAPASHPDALGAIPGPAITIELGSLYDQAAPAKTGVLCVITVDENVTEICVGGNAIRGNVVLEDTAEIIPDPVCELKPAPPEGCLPSGNALYDEYVAVGKPECWCYKYQCYGDADGLENGNLLVGKSRVREQDLAPLLNGWKKQNGKADAYRDPIQDPWICADFDRTQNGNDLVGRSRIREQDLAILMGNWKDDSGIPLAAPTCVGQLECTMVGPEKVCE